MFVSHSVMKDRGSTHITKFTQGHSVFHTTMRKKEVEFNPEEQNSIGFLLLWTPMTSLITTRYMVYVLNLFWKGLCEDFIGAPYLPMYLIFVINLFKCLIIKNQGVFVKHYSMPPAATKLKKAIFSFKVKVKVTRSLTLVSFERASLVEYACQIKSLSLRVQKL